MLIPLSSMQEPGLWKRHLSRYSKTYFVDCKNRETTGVEINADLKRWIMMPKGNKNYSAVIDKLINEDPSEKLEGNHSSIAQADRLCSST